MEKRSAKKGIMWQQLVPYLIALGVLALIFALIIILRGSGGSLIDKIKDFFRDFNERVNY